MAARIARDVQDDRALDDGGATDAEFRRLRPEDGSEAWSSAAFAPL